MAESRLPGPVCRQLKDWGWIDSGTTCRQQAPAPGPVAEKKKALDPVAEAIIKKNYLDHARDVSYIMQATAYVTDSHSVLGGKFLRMYLDGKVDPDTIEEAGEEIGASTTYAELSKKTNQRIQYRVDNVFRRVPSEKEVADVARQYLQGIQKSKKGMAFRGALNPVIGGVSGIDVGPQARFLSKGDTADGVQVEYEIDVTLKDTYDFDNQRSGEYDAYRKRLARLLMDNNFWEFDKAYSREVQPVSSWKKTKLNSNAAIFASYMYALEKRGWTPGPLAWEVTIPMRGVFTHHKKKKAAAKAATK